jgi:hypothetical protein
MMLRVFSVIAAGALVATAGSLGFMAGDRSIPIQVIERSVLDDNARPGGEVVLRYRAVQHRRCDIHTDRVIFDSRGERHLLPALEFKAGIGGKVGEQQEYVVKIKLPVDIAFGKARYETSTVYVCNLVHRLWPVLSPYNPLFFEVRPL